VFGFADPLYFLFTRLFGVECNKDLPGAREWLQQVGQCGRAVVNAQYPMTITRSIFTTLVHSLAPKLSQERPDLQVEWNRFGTLTTIWLDACLRRVDAWQKENGADHRVAITNARFDFEVNTLKTVGWNHWHVMCSPATHAARLKEGGQAPDGKAQADLSENLAKQLDSSVARLLKSNQRGQMLRVIWSDDKVKCPSPRIYTVNQWLQELAVSASPA
jgi:hypothetical protein